MTAVLTQEHIPQILHRISEGEYPAHVAEAIGISKQALQQRMRDVPEYVTARIDGWESRLDGQLELIEKAVADGAIDLVRAREALLKRMEWRAEREFPHRWAQRQHIQLDVTIDVGDKLRRARERTIDSPQVIDAEVIHNTSQTLAIAGATDSKSDG